MSQTTYTNILESNNYKTPIICQAAANVMYHKEIFWNNCSYKSLYMYSALQGNTKIYCINEIVVFGEAKFNVNVTPDLLYFSIWGVYSKTYQNITYGRWKQQKHFCTSSRRLVWWNVTHSTKISAVRHALKAKGKQYWMSLVHYVFFFAGYLKKINYALILI